MLSTGIRTPIGIKVFGPGPDAIAAIGEELERVLRPACEARAPSTPSASWAASSSTSLPTARPSRATACGSRTCSTWSRAPSAAWTSTRPSRAASATRINVRYPRELADDLEALGRVLVPVTMRAGGAGGGRADRHGRDERGEPPPAAPMPGSGLANVPLSASSAHRRRAMGPPMIKSEDGSLIGWVYVDVDGPGPRRLRGATRRQPWRENPPARGLPAVMDRPVRVPGAGPRIAWPRDPVDPAADRRAALLQLAPWAAPRS